MTSDCIASIIVATRDRPEDLARLLPTLLAQDERQFELLVVDQGTTDAAQQVVNSFSDPRIRYFRQLGKGKSRALNLALQNARGNVFAFTDDDCTVTPDWLGTGIRELAADSSVGLAFGNLRAIPHDQRETFVPAIHFSAHQRIHGRPWRSRGLVGMGANMFATRQLFECVGLFDEDLGPGGALRTGEECELTYRALRQRFAIVQCPSLSVLHWGARPRAGGVASRLINDGFFAIGAGYGKHMRHGDLMAASSALHDTVVALALTIDSLTKRKRPLHLRRNILYWQGVTRGFFQAPTPSRVLKKC